MNHLSDNPPDQAFMIFPDPYGGIVGVFRNQPGGAFSKLESLDSQFTLDCGNDDFPVPWFKSAIDDQEIPVMDSGADHGMTLDPDEEACFRVFDQMCVEVKALIHIIVSR